jgi:hypothetical protein
VEALFFPCHTSHDLSIALRRSFKNDHGAAPVPPGVAIDTAHDLLTNIIPMLRKNNKMPDLDLAPMVAVQKVYTPQLRFMEGVLERMLLVGMALCWAVYL